MYHYIQNDNVQHVLRYILTHNTNSTQAKTIAYAKLIKLGFKPWFAYEQAYGAFQ
jgi:hypothetical protein